MYASPAASLAFPFGFPPPLTHSFFYLFFLFFSLLLDNAARPVVGEENVHGLLDHLEAKAVNLAHVVEAAHGVRVKRRRLVVALGHAEEVVDAAQPADAQAAKVHHARKAQIVAGKEREGKKIK